jgi:hypothetical protein
MRGRKTKIAFGKQEDSYTVYVQNIKLFFGISAIEKVNKW